MCWASSTLEIQAKQVRFQANQVTVLSELVGEFGVEQDIQTLFERVLDKIMTLQGVVHTALTLYDPATDDLVITAAKGLPLPIGMRIHMGE
jgi:hypothetical protein